MPQPQLVQQLLEHRDAILGFLFALTREYDTAEELFQVVAMTILEEAGKGTAVTQFLPWAREIARRRVREHFRTHARRQAAELSEAALEEVVCQAFTENEDLCEAHQIQLKFLLERLERLTGRSPEVIEAFYRRRIPIRGIAAALAWQESSVKVALVRARKALADCIQARMRREGNKLTMDAGRFDNLLQQCLSAEATPAELDELTHLLQGDPELRRRYVERSLLEVQLYKALAGLTATGQPSAPAPARVWHTRRWLAAAMVLIAAGAGLFLAFFPKGAPGVEVASGEVLVENRPAARIPHGKPFEVGGRLGAVLLLADGSRAELDPASQGTIHGTIGEVRQVIELTLGGGDFHVAHGSGQFRVDTPLGTVTALGTEFSVKLKPVKAKRAMVVAVAAGTVEVHNNGKRRVLSAGQTRVYGDDGEQNNRDDGEQNNREDGNKGERGSEKQK